MKTKVNHRLSPPKIVDNYTGDKKKVLPSKIVVRKGKIGVVIWNKDWESSRSSSGFKRVVDFLLGRVKTL